MNKTAVEWLVSKILTEVQDYEDGDIETESEPFKNEYVNKYIGMVDLSEFVVKALEIEKQQIEKVFVDVTRATLENLGIKSTIQDVIDFKKIAEVYYNEEFKSK